jgi:hypothetical protein
MNNKNQVAIGQLISMVPIVVNNVQQTYLNPKNNRLYYKYKLLFKEDQALYEGQTTSMSPSGDWKVDHRYEFQIHDLNGWRNFRYIKEIPNKSDLSSMKGTLTDRDAGMVIGACMNKAVDMFISDKRLSLEHPEAKDKGIGFMKMKDIEDVARTFVATSLKLQNEINK